MVSYFLFLSLLHFLSPVFSDDRLALLRLQSAVRGRTLQWNTTSATPCSWEGVKCDTTTNRVVSLRLPGDGLTGQLPPYSIGNLTELRALSLRDNSLSGPIPSDLSSCTHLQDLHLQGNNLSGEIPTGFFALTELARVNLAGNRFSGALSTSGFNGLIKLTTLYLENNQFAGPLPDLNRLLHLTNFNVSFNGLLTGSIPSSLGTTHSSRSFLGTSLCSGPLVPCSNSSSNNNNNNNNLSGGAIAGIAIGSMVVLVLVFVLIFISWRKYTTINGTSPSEMTSKGSPLPFSPVKPPERQSWNVPQSSSIVVVEEDSRSDSSFSSDIRAKERLRAAIKNGGNDGLVFFGEEDGFEGFGLQELLRASAQVMGKGTVGSTYKAYLDSGVEVIVKRLKNVCVSEKEFKDKMEEFASLVHENLEPLRGYFYGRDEKLLIYDSLSNGSLSSLLHGDRNNKRQLSWETRAKIALGAASGFNYLHSVNSGTAHGNINSSNVFLTDNLEARVSEFGLTELVSSVPNSNGYRAPEVNDSRKISQKADVYSFGIVLLELLTGKAPDHVLTEEGIELPNWVNSVVQEKWTIEVFDPDLLVEYENLDEKMVHLLHIAITCTALLPDKRPSMLEVTQRIREICG
ncbi:PREDICTED: probable inactive receptor kinase RLK902 [Erythranthe guttata]|uniref:probable inactive receptor kinase RLK902 n=1 Tax=Erythranthe guttata TaxID=4155 RepID=UPI00064D8449|nr:PREDICTED: probable inactive receptor kinase RLK902 [Erythranthe guttata]|eukprot:XP_012847816.1 PREDICTED: probable inactive receptor kinase RLK902 [Erythranthe guttata]